MTDTSPRPAAARSTAPALLAASLIFLVALNLRPAITSVGPVLPRIGDDRGLGESLQGLLGALPLLAFSLMSPRVHGLARRWGADRAVAAGLVVLAVGIVLRSFGGSAGLWAGTVVLGAAIAVGNVLAPVIVKRDHPRSVSRAMSIYSACVTAGAAASSVIAVPLAGATSWQTMMAVWALPALLIGLVWGRATWHRDAAGPPAPGAEAAASVWRQRTAWLVTAYMGLQSCTFYVMVTWLPTIEHRAGISESTAGVHLFVFQAVGVIAGLAVPRLMRRSDGHVVVATAAATLPMVAGALGLVVAPSLALLWATLAGVGAGAALEVSLTLIGLRGRSQDETTRLSGMAQSVGYLIAAAGPVATGALADATGSWDASLVLIAAIATLNLVAGLAAGRPRAPLLAA